MTKFYQRDIVKLSKIKMSDGRELPHPVLIISCEAINSHDKDRCYLGVMLTHSTNTDRFTKEVVKEMMETHWNEGYVQIRLHILVRFREEDISRDSTHHVGRMKPFHFKNVLEEIKQYVLMADK